MSLPTEDEAHRAGAKSERERISAWLLAEAGRLGESDSHDSRVASAAHAHAAVKIIKGEI